MRRDPTKLEIPLGARRLAAYQRDGYLALEGVLDDREVERAREALSIIIRRTHTAAISRSPEVQVQTPPATNSVNSAGLEVVKRTGGFEMDYQAGIDPFSLDEEQAELSVRVLYGYCGEHPTFAGLLSHPRIMSIVESIVGKGALPFSEMALIKPPLIGTEKPWHQDNAYFTYAPLEQIVGVWIALDEARADNGCMHVIPGGHRNTGVKHWHSALDCEIVEGRIDPARAVPIELEPGGALFFNGLLPHRTPMNTSPRRRRALQFHYRGANTRKLDPMEYDRVFVEADGSPASCKAARPSQ